MKTIGIIAPSGCVSEEKINNARSNLEKSGFNVKLSRNIFDKNRYLAGSDNDKLEDLEKFFADPEVDIIMAARGGYGAIRLINKIDYEIIKNNPKPLVGFSDITALLLMIYKLTGMVTYHGPMACSDFGEIAEPSLSYHNGVENRSFTLTNFLQAINGNKLKFEGKKVYKKGKAEGIIWGGNLATVVSLCGLDFIPDKDFVFFTEDLNEQVYKIDRMFTQLFNIEKFRKNCKGIVLGDFLDVDNKEWLEDLFYEIPVPAAGGFRITHAKDKITIPIGKECILDGESLIIF